MALLASAAGRGADVLHLWAGRGVADSRPLVSCPWGELRVSRAARGGGSVLLLSSPALGPAMLKV